MMAIHSGAPWSKQDLFFLDDSLRHGRSLAEVASFLRRDEDEVREKAKELKLAEQFRDDGQKEH